MLRCDWGKVILADPCHRRRFGPVDNHCPPPASATGLPMEESELEAAHRHVTQSRRIVATQHERVARLKANGHILGPPRKSLSYLRTRCSFVSNTSRRFRLDRVHGIEDERGYLTVNYNMLGLRYGAFPGNGHYTPRPADDPRHHARAGGASSDRLTTRANTNLGQYRLLTGF